MTCCLPPMETSARAWSQPTGKLSDIPQPPGAENTKYSQATSPAPRLSSLKRAQRAHSINSFLEPPSSPAKKFYLISHPISYPLNQWEFPFIKLFPHKGAEAEPVNSSHMADGRVTVQHPRRNKHDWATLTDVCLLTCRQPWAREPGEGRLVPGLGSQDNIASRVYFPQI
jgi:hypothetical protein